MKKPLLTAIPALSGKLPGLLLAGAILLAGLNPTTASWAQTLDEIKKGVVRISAQAEGKHKEGTGFIVHLEREAAYVVTASHVIEGDREPRITFFVEPNRPLPATVVGLESGDPKGLALLLLKDKMPAGLQVLSLDPSARISGGETVSLIGFPRLSGTSWAVTQGTIAGQKGRELTFTAPADEGNSGGPLIQGGRVVGVITELAGQFGYAAPAITVRFALQGWGVSLGEPPQSLVQPGEAHNDAAQLLKMAKLQSQNRDFRSAWGLIEEAIGIQPSAEGSQSQLELAMAWLRNIAIKQGETFTAIVDQVLPALYRGVASGHTVVAADSLAHIGYGNYLKRREGMQGLEVDANYKKSLELDPENVYAHTMWGHWILLGNGSLEQAREHFSRALKSGRDREFVRGHQLGALRGDDRGESAMEIIRVLDEMRRNEEPLNLRLRERLASRVYFGARQEVLERLPSILPPSDHLATYQWLKRDFKRSDGEHDFWLARLTEAAGCPKKALSMYRSIQSAAKLGLGWLKQEVEDGIKRCEAKIRTLQ